MTLRGKLRALAGGREVRGGTSLILSSVIAQGIALLATPFLSRLYGPDAFGYLTLVIAVTGTITPAVALRLESALMLPKRADHATALLVLGLLSTFFISVFSTLILEFLLRLGFFEPMARLPGFSLWVGGITLLSGAFALLGQFALRQRNYNAVAVRNVTQAATTAAAQLGLAFISASPAGLVAGYAGGRAVGVIPLLASIRGEVRRFALADITVLLREYRLFPLLFTPAALMNAAALALPLIFTGLVFEVADAGQWGMAERVLAVPMVIIATAVGQVVETRLALNVRMDRAGSARYYLRVSYLLAAFSVTAGFAVVFLAPTLVPLVLGREWMDAALIMQLLTPMLMTRLIASPLSKALVVAQWARTNLLLDAVRLVFVCVVLAVCWTLGSNLHVFVLATSGCFSLIYIATWIAGYRAVIKLDRGAARIAEAKP